MQECELLKTCGFFLKYQDDLSLICRSFINSYCKGDKVQECLRKRYRLEHGEPPCDEMMPSGELMHESVKSQG